MSQVTASSSQRQRSLLRSYSDDRIVADIQAACQSADAGPASDDRSVEQCPIDLSPFFDDAVADDALANRAPRPMLANGPTTEFSMTASSATNDGATITDPLRAVTFEFCRCSR